MTIRLHTSTWQGVMGEEDKLFAPGSQHKILWIIPSKDIQNMHTPFAVDPQKILSVFGTGRSVNFVRDVFMSEHLSCT